MQSGFYSYGQVAYILSLNFYNIFLEGFIKYLGTSKEIVKADLMDILTSKASREVLLEKTQDLLENVFSLSSECVHLAVYENNSLLYLNQVDNSTRVIKLRDTIGTHAPLHCTALGKILLAYEEIDLDDLDLDEYTKNTLTKQRYLKKEIEITKKRLYAIENEEYEYGLCSLSVAIFNMNNEFLAAIGISALSTRVSEDKLHSLAKEILKISSKNIRM